MRDADFSLAREHTIYQLLNTPNKGYPFPHSYIENFFPKNFYDQIQTHMLDETDLMPLSSSGLVKIGAFQERSILQMPSERLNALKTSQQIFWNNMSELLNSIELQTALLHKFQPLVDHRLGKNLGGDTVINSEVLFFQDKGGFSIGPHPDVNSNVVVLLIYLPQTDNNIDSGTSLYAPKDRGFKCEIGCHYAVEFFDRIYTFEYRPNTAICFLKTSTSFHGVEQIPITDDLRNLIQVSIQHDPVTKPL
jgi:hypothetical protein